MLTVNFCHTNRPYFVFFVYVRTLTNAMGNADSMHMVPFVDEDKRRQSMFMEEEVKQMINICLCCQTDNVVQTDPVGEYDFEPDHFKRFIRNFLQSVYHTDKSTVYTWTTLCVTPGGLQYSDDIAVNGDNGCIDGHFRTKADIVLSGENDFDEASSAFDVCIGVNCKIRNIRPAYFTTMCRLLKPSGLLILKGNDTTLSEAMTGLPDFECEPGSGMIPVFSAKDHSEEPGHTKLDLTIMQKL